MAAGSSAPRDVLWYHQIQKENRHLLERMNKQQAEVDRIKSQLSTSEEQRATLEQALSQVESKQSTTMERRRDDFEREKELLKRIGTLEASLRALGESEVRRDRTARENSQWQDLEQRVKSVEQRQAPPLATSDMETLTRRVDLIEKAMHKVDNPMVRQKEESHRAVNDNDEVEGRGNATVTDVASMDATTLGQTESNSKRAKLKEMDSKRELSDKENRPVLVQKKRRRERELRIPFRPTPPDMGW